MVGLTKNGDTRDMNEFPTGMILQAWWILDRPKHGIMPSARALRKLFPRWRARVIKTWQAAGYFASLISGTPWTLLWNSIHTIFTTLLRAYQNSKLWSRVVISQLDYWTSLEVLTSPERIRGSEEDLTRNLSALPWWTISRWFLQVDLGGAWSFGATP